MDKRLLELEKLKSRFVIKVEPVKDSWGTHYILHFSNGMKLTSRDGEYGTDAFELYNKNEKID